MSTVPLLSHEEQHFSSPELVRDCVLGLSDGLTVPFALAAGLSSLDNSSIVVTAGFAELVAGAISMGLGGYLSARSEQQHYQSERRREQREIQEMPEVEQQEVVDILAEYGLTRDVIEPMVEQLRRNEDKWIDFMMRFDLGLEPISANRAIVSAVTIAASYFVGGLVPLVPYLLVERAKDALVVSVSVTLAALFVFGVIKNRFVNPEHIWAGAFQTMAVGAVAAFTAYTLVKITGQVGA